MAKDCTNEWLLTTSMASSTSTLAKRIMAPQNITTFSKNSLFKVTYVKKLTGPGNCKMKMFSLQQLY